MDNIPLHLRTLAAIVVLIAVLFTFKWLGTRANVDAITVVLMLIVSGLGLLLANAIEVMNDGEE